MKLAFDPDFIYNFVAGGLLIAIAGYISKFYSSYASGLLYGSLPLGAYYLYLYSIYNDHTQRNLKKEVDKGLEFIHGSVIGGILWVIMVAMLYLNIHNPIAMVVISSIIYTFIILLQIRFIDTNTN